MKKIINFIAIVTIALVPVSISLGADVGTRIDTANILQNYLSTNGCEHTVVIKWQEYALEYPSYIALQNAFLKRIDGMGHIRQRITYDITGRNGTVSCGRGVSKTLPEVRIVSYIPKYTIASVAKLLPNRYGIDTYGCQHTISIWDTNYTLDASAYAKVLNEFSNSINPELTIYKRITYRLTGKTSVLYCGWGNNTNLPEISINTIK
jgi:hypothetical protein